MIIALFIFAILIIMFIVDDQKLKEASAKMQAEGQKKKSSSLEKSLADYLSANKLEDCIDRLWQNDFGTLDSFSNLKFKDVKTMGFDRKQQYLILLASQRCNKNPEKNVCNEDYAELYQLCCKYEAEPLFAILPKMGIRSIHDLFSFRARMKSLGMNSNDLYVNYLLKMVEDVAPRSFEWETYPQTSSNYEQPVRIKTFNELLSQFSQTKKISLDDSYSLFGAKRSTSLTEIRKTYIFMAKQFHPDINSSSYAQDASTLINTAWEQIKENKKQ